jgi:F420-non-reducing hydrogenase iron-sulfur subunit
MEQKAKLVILACSQAVPAPERLSAALDAPGLSARVALEPCSSKIEVYQLLRILAQEADLVWMIGCPEQDCRFLEGSARMGKRVAYAQEYLTEINLEPQRLGMSHITPGDEEALAAAAGEIKTLALALGPLPCRTPQGSKEST